MEIAEHEHHAPETKPPSQRPAGMTEWHSISVTRFSDGSSRALYNRLDPSTRKLVSTWLPEPLSAPEGYSWHVMALLCAAEELEARERDDRGL